MKILTSQLLPPSEVGEPPLKISEKKMTDKENGAKYAPEKHEERQKISARNEKK